MSVPVSATSARVNEPGTPSDLSWRLTPSPSAPAPIAAEADTADRVAGPPSSNAARSGDQSQRLPKLPAPKSKGALDSLADNVVIRRYGAQKRHHPDRDSNASLVDPARYEPRSEQRAQRCTFERNTQVANGGCDTATTVDAHLAITDHLSLGGQGSLERTQFQALGGADGAGNLYQKYGMLDVRYTAGQPGDLVRPFVEGGAGLARYTVGFDGNGLPLGERQKESTVMGRVTAGTVVRLNNETEIEVGAEYRHGGAFDYRVTGPGGQDIALNTNAIRDDKRVFVRATVGFQTLDEVFGNWIR